MVKPIDVKGLGIIHFPDDMDDEAIDKAIKELPEYKSLLNKQQKMEPLIEPPNWLKDILGDPRQSPSPPTVARQIAKGMPIAGGFVPQTPEMSEMEAQWPKATMAAQFGGAGATIGAPFAAGAKVASKGLPWLLTQLGIGNTLGLGDLYARKPKEKINNRDIMMALATGNIPTGMTGGLKALFGSSGAAPTATKFIAKPPTGGSYEDILTRARWHHPKNIESRKMLEKTVDEKRASDIAKKVKEMGPSEWSTGAWGLGALGAGYLAGHPDIGGFAGLALPHLAKHFETALKGGKVTPEIAAQMQALITTPGIMVQRHLSDESQPF